MNRLYRIVLSAFVVSTAFLLAAWRDGAMKGRVKTLIKMEYIVKYDSALVYHSILSIKGIYKYDTLGHQLEAKMYNGSEWTDKTIYHYNDKGLLSENIMYKYVPQIKDSILRSYTTYTYDSAGKRIVHDSIAARNWGIEKTKDGLRDSMVFYPSPIPRTSKSQNKVTNQITINYPFTKKRKELRLTNADETKFIMKYYKKGSYKKSIRIDTSGYRSIEKFDRKGNCIENSIYKPDGTLVEKRVIEPEKKGISTIKIYTGKVLTDITINKYTYDKFGNMVVDSTFDNDTLKYIYIQQFEYY